ncbi:hypothetical protein IQ255_11860 [Pleurocapsales cyanobacterium LEGE 10410]|nr:hypothetical protein [Pleurocapsales cyanobacterium LEGE 10410]
MDLNNIPQQSGKLINKVTNAVEKTGKKVANQVSNVTNGQAEELTEEAIQGAVSQALNILQIAGDEVRQKDINSERVTLEVTVGVINVAHLKVVTDVPSKGNKNSNDRVDVELS